MYVVCAQMARTNTHKVDALMNFIIYGMYNPDFYLVQVQTCAMYVAHKRFGLQTGILLLKIL